MYKYSDVVNVFEQRCTTYIRTNLINFFRKLKAADKSVYYGISRIYSYVAIRFSNNLNKQHF